MQSPVPFGPGPRSTAPRRRGRHMHSSDPAPGHRPSVSSPQLQPATAMLHAPIPAVHPLRRTGQSHPPARPRRPPRLFLKNAPRPRHRVSLRAETWWTSLARGPRHVPSPRPCCASLAREESGWRPGCLLSPIASLLTATCLDPLRAARLTDGSRLEAFPPRLSAHKQVAA